jgi:hypothetical protein
MYKLLVVKGLIIIDYSTAQKFEEALCPVFNTLLVVL